jgi:hypothetical protein
VTSSVTDRRMWSGRPDRARGSRPPSTVADGQPDRAADVRS